ncbi:MAG: N-acetylmuramoyl-L-alanine amidase [Candidatus Pacebacteria bacterium]|nr:N-acetylmuramoyl-L-alanine amidase [Candidatus Paceibacterota bacterium]
MQIITSPSPNFDERRNGARPELIVMHYTGMESGAAALARLCDAAAKVSSHYLVEEDGRVFALVEESQRAWHAGHGEWRRRDDINSHSIGIELVNPGHEFGYRPFPQAQIAAVRDLSLAIMARHGIVPQDVIAHSDLAPSRKTDPGELFPWEELAAAGVGVYPPPLTQHDENFVPLKCGDHGHLVTVMQEELIAYGWHCPTSGRFDQTTVEAVLAFQRHFRGSRVDGVWDGDCARIMNWLLGERNPFTCHSPQG